MPNPWHPGGSRQAEAGNIFHAGGSRQAEARIPHGARIAVVTTRRAQPAADALGGCVFGKYILHDMLASVTAPLHELSIAHVIVLEVPPICTYRFDHDLLGLVQKLLAFGAIVLVAAQPSLRRKSD